MLSKDRTLEFTTVDHQGVVQFLNGNIISAASKDKKIALQTVNMNRFRVSLFKISSSDLASYSADPLNEAQYRWSATSKITEHGKFLGSKEISINGVKNQKNITMLNLNDLTDDLSSGLYMLVLTEPDFEECDATLDCIEKLSENYESLMLAKSIVVTDLGVTTYRRDRGIDIAVRSLTTAEPVAGAKVSLINGTNDVIRTVTADRDGYAHFSRADISGKHSQNPTLISVTSGKDTYIHDLRSSSLSIEDNFTSDPALASSDELNVYSYTNRTLVRPGEKVLYEAIVRDGKMKAADLKAMKLMIVRPDDQIYREVTLKDPKSGAFEYEFEFDESAITGNWQFKLGFDKKRIVSTTSVKVDNFIPSSIKTKFQTGSSYLTSSDQVTVNTRFIYDAPAPNVAVSGNYSTKLDNHPVEKYSEFFFGPNSSDSAYSYESFDTILTDRSGNARIDLSSIEPSNIPRSLEINAEVVDPNSKILSYSKTFKLAVAGPMVGVKTEFSKTNPRESDMQVILADQLP